PYRSPAIPTISLRNGPVFVLTVPSPPPMLWGEDENNMGQRQSLTWKQGQGGERFELAGEITEESDFAPLGQSLPSASTLDLAEVRRINSCGVREWLNFVTALSKAGKQIVLERCSVPMVAQMNMITNFRGDARVASIFAPYHCPSCDEDHDELINLAQN